MLDLEPAQLAVDVSSSHKQANDCQSTSRRIRKEYKIPGVSASHGRYKAATFK